LLYTPLPFLVWATVRLGTIGTSTATLVVALLETRGAINQVGPFVASSPSDSALSIQLCLILASIPLLLLSAVIQERSRAERAAVFNAESVKLALNAAHWGDSSNKLSWLIPELAERLPDAKFVHLVRVVHPDDQLVVAEAITAAIEKAAPWDVEFRGAHRRQCPLGDGQGRGPARRARASGASPGRQRRHHRPQAGRRGRARVRGAFARAFRSSPDAMLISRRTGGQIIDVNDRWETLFGYTRAAVIGRTMAELPSRPVCTTRRPCDAWSRRRAPCVMSRLSSSL
jgi:PAS domain-containing protein